MESIHKAPIEPQFVVLTDGRPHLANSQGVPWTGDSNLASGDQAADTRSDIALGPWANGGVMTDGIDPHV